MENIAKYRILIITFIFIIFVSISCAIGYVVTSKISDNRERNKASENNLSQTDTSFDGTYTGSNKIIDGIAKTTVKVTNNSTITGTSIYTGPNDITIPITIDGKVNANGEFSGSLSGGGSVNGDIIRAEGSFTGNIEGKKANITYSISTNDTTIRNYTTLIKQ